MTDPKSKGLAEPRPKRKLLTRRNFFKGLGCTGAGAVGGGLYMRYCESEWLETLKHDVKFGERTNPQPLHLLHLSDLHASPVVSLDYLRRAITRALALKPDFICVTGDFVTRQYDEMKAYAAILKPLSEAAPTFACLGNHDGGAWSARYYHGFDSTTSVRNLIEDSGMQLLHNHHQSLTLKGRTLQLVGVGDLWARECDPATAFASLPTDVARPTTVLLSHNPDSKDVVGQHAWDLMLSGHTHGGQLELPLFGTPFAPVRDKRYVRGLRRWNDRWIHTTKGVGNLHGMRFNCRPDISLLTLI